MLLVLEESIAGGGGGKVVWGWIWSLLGRKRLQAPCIWNFICCDSVAALSQSADQWGEVTDLGLQWDQLRCYDALAHWTRGSSKVGENSKALKEDVKERWSLEKEILVIQWPIIVSICSMAQQICPWLFVRSDCLEAIRSDIRSVVGNNKW